MRYSASTGGLKSGEDLQALCNEVKIGVYNWKILRASAKNAGSLDTSVNGARLGHEHNSSARMRFDFGVDYTHGLKVVGVLGILHRASWETFSFIAFLDWWLVALCFSYFQLAREIQC